jgi:hypothetical protein
VLSYHIFLDSNEGHAPYKDFRFWHTGHDRLQNSYYNNRHNRNNGIADRILRMDCIVDSSATMGKAAFAFQILNDIRRKIWNLTR